MPTTQLNATLIVTGVFFILVILVILARLYKRSSKELAFVRTGLGGEKVILDGGCLKLPVLHEIVPVNMRTLRLRSTERTRKD